MAPNEQRRHEIRLREWRGTTATSFDVSQDNNLPPTNGELALSGQSRWSVRCVSRMKNCAEDFECSFHVGRLAGVGPLLDLLDRPARPAGV